ncbi:hypothetical protein E2C01_090021 [Portunus trituberculatus]|uniref:Uncharacterized protein n=1 Tax=Portunus trituberculatus TaxID=210409 RepID=A0A5B7JR55_PORTR|nr:hypothetical protein [Portunus trituberculatus]
MLSSQDIGLAKYGILAFGDLRVSNDDCLSSSLLLHDNDDATDQAAVSETGSFEFRTMEDVLLVTFTHREGSEAREGALITILPEVVCGGVITSDTTIAINHHFKAPYVCNWELMVMLLLLLLLVVVVVVVVILLLPFLLLLYLLSLVLLLLFLLS